MTVNSAWERLLGKAIPYRGVVREKERVTWYEVPPLAEALRELAMRTSPNRRFVALEDQLRVSSYAGPRPTCPACRRRFWFFKSLLFSSPFVKEPSVSLLMDLSGFHHSRISSMPDAHLVTRRAAEPGPSCGGLLTLSLPSSGNDFEHNNINQSVSL